MRKFGNLLIFSGLFILFLVGCGPSEEDIATMIADALAQTPEPTLTSFPTSTYTPHPTTTNTPTVTFTNTPTSTFTVTPTPEVAILGEGNRVGLLAHPGGPEIGVIYRDQPFKVLYGSQIYNGWVWIEVEDQEGRIGWIPQYLTTLVTQTPVESILDLTPELSNLDFECDNNLNGACENIFPPDTLIAFSSENRNQLSQSTHYDIWTMDPNYPTILKQLTNTTEDDLMSVWSPDGERIVFARYAPFRIGHNEDASLWVIDRDGPTGSERMILDWWYVGGGGIQPYFWYIADDGDRIYYMKDPGGSCHFYWIYADGEPDQPENPVIGGESICQAGISPDGNLLVFNYYGNKEFYTADFIVDQGVTRVENKAPFLSNFDIVAHPHWSPNGDQIAFGRFYGPSSDVYITDVENQQDLRKISLSNNTWQNSWSPDSNWIVTKEFGGLAFYSIKTYATVIYFLTDDGIMDHFPDWSP